MTKAQLEQKVMAIANTQPSTAQAAAQCYSKLLAVLADYFADTSCNPPMLITEGSYQFKNPKDDSVPTCYLTLDPLGVKIQTTKGRTIGIRTWQHMGVESPMPLTSTNFTQDGDIIR